jgi:hypothetical protein
VGLTIISVPYCDPSSLPNPHFSITIAHIHTHTYVIVLAVVSNHHSPLLLPLPFPPFHPSILHPVVSFFASPPWRPESYSSPHIIRFIRSLARFPWAVCILLAMLLVTLFLCVAAALRRLLPILTPILVICLFIYFLVSHISPFPPLFFLNILFVPQLVLILAVVGFVVSNSIGNL